MAKFVKPYIQAKRLNTRKTPMPWKPRFLDISKEPSIPYPLNEPLQPKKIDLSRFLNVQTGDLVRVLYGADKGKDGTVLRIDTRRNKVYVQGCNKKKVFWNPLYGKKKFESSLVTTEMPIHITNLAPLDPITKTPTRVKRRYMMNGECVRISKISGAAMPTPVPVVKLKPAIDYEAIHMSTPKAESAPIPRKYEEYDKASFDVLKKLSRYYTYKERITPKKYTNSFVTA